MQRREVQVYTIESQQATKEEYDPNSEYDILRRRVRPGEPRQYVTTDVANALLASRNFQISFSGATAEDFKKADPINSAIVDDWLTTHNPNDGYIIKNDDLAGLLIR